MPATIPELTANLGNIALLRIAAECGLIPADLAETVRDAYREYRRLQHQRRLNNLDSRIAAAPHAQRIAAVRQLWSHVFWRKLNMPVNYTTPAPDQLFPVAGVRLGVAEAGIRKANRRDLTLIELAPGSRVAGVFTKNRFCAAPVHVCREHLKQEGIRALVINTGIANAGTGEPGMEAARQSCAALAKLMDLRADQVLPFSTGVILEPLPVERLKAGLPAALSALKADGWHDAAHAIMTTDTVAKAASRRLAGADFSATITGMAKGAGMIRPNMATMLGFVATDATISQPHAGTPGQGSGRRILQLHHHRWRHLDQRLLHPHRHRPGHGEIRIDHRAGLG